MMKKKQAELISIGNELLAGYTINTNSSFIAQNLLKIGLPVSWISTISDEHGEIIRALELANKRADAVIITGGLGPTPDDITKNSICEYFDTSLVENSQILEDVEKFLANRGLSILESNRGQAMVPVSAEILRNSVGTAPGLLLKKENTFFFFTPGVPREMKFLVIEYILPHLSKNLDLPVVQTRLLRTTGIAESRLYETMKELMSANPEYQIAFLPRHIGVDLRFRLITEKGKDVEAFENFISEIRKKIQKYIFTDREIDLEEKLGEILKEKKLSLATAESFTGGLLSDWITNIPGSSEYYFGGHITYNNESKIKYLGVSSETINTHGAVSKETALEMVRGVRKSFNSDCAIATTGIAGPGGATSEKAVGLCYIAAISGNQEVVKEFHFGKDREINKMRGAVAGLELLRRLLLKIS
ncbi:MAG: competence/damage-inducible protein A [Calditrichaceae bacterium]